MKTQQCRKWAAFFLVWMIVLSTGCSKDSIPAEQTETPGREQEGSIDFAMLNDPEQYRGRTGVLTADFYVSPEGDDSWSGMLPAPNRSGTDGPFHTLEKARDTLRRIIAKGMDRDYTVALRGGFYNLTSPVRFDERDSGRDGWQIRYSNYINEEPILDGAAPVTKWEHYEGEIYKAAVNPFWQVGGLHENDISGVLARFPNEGYLHAVGMDEEHPRRIFRMRVDEVPVVERLREVHAYVWSGGPEGEWNWFADTVKVDEIKEDGTIALRNETHYEIGPGSRFYLQGAIEFLDQPGEYTMNKRDGILYYRPRQLPIEEQHITVSNLMRLVEFRGTGADKPVENILFEGIVLRNSGTPEQVLSSTPNDGMITLQFAQNIIIRGCKLLNAGYHGVLMSGWNQQNTIYGNLFHDIGHTGIQVNGPWSTSEYNNKGHLISNNHLWDLGNRIGHGSGIQLINSGDNQITHNRIHDVSRYGISLKGIRPGMLVGTTIDDVLITPENVHEFNHTRNNTIAWNDIFRANLDSQDGGLIEAWGPGLGNIIHNNALHDSEIPFSFGFGLYLDDASNEFTVTNNLVYNLNHHGEGQLFFGIYAKGVNNIIQNNVIAQNNAQAAIGSMEMAGEPNHGLVIEKNIFYDTGHQVYGFFNWHEDRYKRADHNILFHPEGRYEIGGVPDIREFDQWREMKNLRFDHNSLTTDPLFLNAAEGDFRLRPDSPAFPLGFVETDVASIGLLEDFPFDKEDDPLARLFLTALNSNTIMTLSVDQEKEIQLMGRTRSGRIIDVSTADIVYKAAAADIAVVQEGNMVKALKGGITRVTAEVSLDGVTQRLDFFVRVQ